MTRFRYESTDRGGQPHTGEREAESAEALRAALELEGLTVGAIAPISPDDAAPARATSPPPPVAPRDAQSLLDEVAAAARAGVPIGPALEALASELPPGPLADAAAGAAARLAAGAPLEEALGGLPPHLTGLLRAGIESGRLGEVLNLLAVQREESAQMRRELRTALAYPLLVLLILLPIGLMFLFWITPMFSELFVEFELELPHITATMVWLSQTGLPLILGGLAIAAGLLLVARLGFGREGFESIWFTVPLLGPAWSAARVAECVRLLALLLRSGLPLPDALRLTGESLGGARVAAACRRAADRVGEGGSLADVTARSRSFPAMLTPLVAWGERSGTLPEALDIAGDVFVERVRLESRLAQTLIPPIVFIVAACGIMALVTALFLPLVRLISYLT